MEWENNQTEEQVHKEEAQSVPFGRKLWAEVKDILVGVAFPLIVMLVISSTVTLFASYTDDVAVSVIALVGGEIMMVAALVIFGRANGSAAYEKTILNKQKRDLGSTDESVICKTGEFAIWKGILIGVILCLPFLIFQTVELCAPNLTTSFLLQYMCGWAYFPFSYLGKAYQPLNYILIIIPIAAHTAGYYLGKIKRLKLQQQLAEQEYNGKGKRRRK